MNKKRVKALRKQFIEKIGRKPEKAIVQVSEIETLIPNNRGQLVKGKKFEATTVKKNEFRRFKKEAKNG